MSTNNHTAISTGAAANASTINTPLGTLDAAIGDLTTLTTTVKTSAVAALNELDADMGAAASTLTTTAKNFTGAINELDTAVDVNTAAIAGLAATASTTNLMWDPINQHVEDKGNWGGKSWWEDNAAVTIVADGTNPWAANAKVIRSTVSAKGKGIYLSDVGLAPGDVISAAMSCKAASGTYQLRLIFRTSGPAGSAVSTPTGTAQAFSGTTLILTNLNVTIPATANWVCVVAFSAAPTSLDIYGIWVHRGATQPGYPSPSPVTATYLRYKEWESDMQRLVVRNVDATNFYVYQPLQDANLWLRWSFTKLASNNWTYNGAYVCTSNTGAGAYEAITYDIGYSIYYTPNGMSGETCGNHHLYDDFTSVNFYDEDGTAVTATTASSVTFLKKFRIEQKGTLRHPDTSTTDHATISRFIEITVDGIYEHQRLTWLTDTNTVGYWNTGQLLATSANRAYFHNKGSTYYISTDASDTVTGVQKSYTWYASRAFAFMINCPTAEATQYRTSTMKLYPRTIEDDVTRNTGDVDHAEWYWSTIFDKEFGKRI